MSEQVDEFLARLARMEADYLECRTLRHSLGGRSVAGGGYPAGEQPDCAGLGMRCSRSAGSGVRGAAWCVRMRSRSRRRVGIRR